MHYGKRKIEERQLMLRSKARRVHSFFLVVALRILFLVSVIACAAVLSGAYGAFMGIISKSPSLAAIDKLPEENASVIYYSDGVTVAGSLPGNLPESRYVLYDDISGHIVNAFIATQDQDFPNHKGINVRSYFTADSFGLDLLTDEDRYTITQRLLKERLFPEYSKDNYYLIQQLIKEHHLAAELEKTSSKKKIMEYYLNSLNFGNSHGICSASMYYFNRHPRDISLSEACVLAAAATDPAGADPIYNRQANKQKRQTVLSRMLLLELITREQYDEAVSDSEAVYERIDTIVDTAPDYFNEALRAQIIEDLMAEGYSSYDAVSLLYNGGLSIYSTQDPDIQNILDYEFRSESNFPAVGDGSWYELSPDWELTINTKSLGQLKYGLQDLLDNYSTYVDSENAFLHRDGSLVGITSSVYSKDEMDRLIGSFISLIRSDSDVISVTEKNHFYTLEPQASMVIMDQTSGAVLAIYGCRGRESRSSSVNRATDYYRSPGSAFMVPAVFMPALDSGSYTLASNFDDSYYSYQENDALLSIDNWYSTGYEGLSSIRRGIYHSMNIVSARCFDRIGAVSSLSYLKRLGFSKLNQAGDRGVELAVGSLNGGVSLLELTSAYAAIADGGLYNKPRFYTAVYDKNGKLLLGESSKSRITKTSTAVLLTDAMKDTVKLGTGTRCSFDGIDVEIAGKTGITEDHSDLWFCGYTPYYCAGIWSGADNSVALTKTQYHKTLWKRVMEKVHVIKGQTEGSFTLPDNIVSCSICKKCGKLAVEGLCDSSSAGNLTVTEYFTEDTAPTTNCSCCRKISVCDYTGMAASENCPDTHTVIVLDKSETPEALSHGGTADSDFCITPEMTYTCSFHRKNEITESE